MGLGRAFFFSFACFEDVLSSIFCPSHSPGILQSLFGLLRGGRRGRERRDSQEQRFSAAGLLELGDTLALWQKVMGWVEPATI